MTNRDCTRENAQRGYALLFVLFLVALVLIGTSVATLNQLTEGRRQKEAYMIWCGEQYERAIGLYYRKYGKFPTSLDDLVKVQKGLRFLREKYPNPMNTKDGSWRLIYVTPAGVLVGSVNYKTLQEMALVDKMREMGIAAGQNGTTPTGVSGKEASQSSGGGSAGPGGASGPTTGSGATSAPESPAKGPQPNPPGQGANSLPGSVGSTGAQPTPISPQSGQPQDLESSGPVFGGFIIGVGGKSDKPSLKVYKGGKTYKHWEFIYNPLEQVQTFGGVSNVPGAQPAGQPPAKPSPFGLTPQPPKPQQKIPQ